MSTPDPIDRITATRRPAGSALMRQRWSELLFLHWRVPEADMRAVVPDGLEIDTFDGSAWLGVVPFTVSGARPRLLPPLPFLSNFHEVNVRTYVHRHGRDPGVWFFSLDASNTIVVEAARHLYKLPYRYARIDFHIDEPRGEGATAQPRQLSFVSRRVEGDRPELEVRYRAADFPRPAEPGTLEHFLVERYILYTSSEQGLHSARVHHQPYPVQAAAVQGLQERLIAADGLGRPDSEPLAHYASTVDVEIFRLEAVG